jgi:hypothetical protein
LRNTIDYNQHSSLPYQHCKTHRKTLTSNLLQYKIVGSSLLATRVHNAIYVRADQIKMGQTLENFIDKTKIAVLLKKILFLLDRRLALSFVMCM